MITERDSLLDELVKQIHLGLLVRTLQRKLNNCLPLKQAAAFSKELDQVYILGVNPYLHSFVPRLVDKYTRTPEVNLDPLPSKLFDLGDLLYERMMHNTALK